MEQYAPKQPIGTQIRRIIFENYNDVDASFTNDDVFARLKEGGDVGPDWIVDDIEPHINEICDSGLARNIAQNFTTMWLKLFDVVEQLRCDTCKSDVFVGRLEERVCPNPECGAGL